MSCHISRTEVMSKEGWQAIDASDGSNVFELYADGNKTFLQWLGSDFIRRRLQHKLVRVQFDCTALDAMGGTIMKNNHNNDDEDLDSAESREGSDGQDESQKAPYKACAAMRVGWVPGAAIITGTTFIETPPIVIGGNSMHTNRESQLHGNIVTSSGSSGSNRGEQKTTTANNSYLIVGLSLGVLGLMYILALMVYLRFKKLGVAASGGPGHKPRQPMTPMYTPSTITSGLSPGSAVGSDVPFDLSGHRSSQHTISRPGSRAHFKKNPNNKKGGGPGARESIRETGSTSGQIYEECGQTNVKKKKSKSRDSHVVDQVGGKSGSYSFNNRLAGRTDLHDEVAIDLELDDAGRLSRAGINGPESQDLDAGRKRMDPEGEGEEGDDEEEEEKGFDHDEANKQVRRITTS